MNMKGRLSVLITLLGLAGLTPSSLASPDTNIVRSAISQIQQRLVDLSSKPKFDTPLFTFSSLPSSPPKRDPNNCVVSPQRDVQKVWFQDQPGTDLTLVQPKDAQNPLSWQELAAYVRGFKFRPPLTPLSRAAIIVIDDFSTPMQYLSQNLPGIDNSSIKLTHGDLIHAQIKASLGTDFSEHIRLVDVAFTEGEKTSALNTRIESQIGVLAMQEYKSIVLNMSFVVMSCGVLENYKNWLSHTSMSNIRIGMKAYIDELWVAYRQKYGGGNEPTYIFMAAVMSANVIDPNLEDPLGSQTVPFEIQVQRVAAAGNFGLPYALYPAALPNVIGVAATLSDHVTPAKTYLSGNPPSSNLKAWSNAGDVVEIGQWLTVRLNWKGTLTPFYYLGTSFSTPIVSVLTAINAMEKNCAIPANNNWNPSVSYSIFALLKNCYR